MEQPVMKAMSKPGADSPTQDPTPREKMIVALEGGAPPGPPPHFELVFKRCEEFVGRKRLEKPDLEGVEGDARQRLLRENAKMWAEVYRRLDWALCTGFHGLDMEDQARSFDYFRDEVGDEIMIAGFADGTYHMPNGTNMMQMVTDLFERRDELMIQHDEGVRAAMAQVDQFAEMGAEAILMCTDYCFNEGPWLSPDMFAEHVTPYLAQAVEHIQERGMYAIKHTDGDIMPILDQLAGAGIDALHSLDPMAGVDVAEVRRRVGPDLCLCGNVDCALVHAGTPEETYDSAVYCLTHGGVDNGAYVFCTSNCIFEGVPLENYFAMLQAREDFGGPGESHELPAEPRSYDAR
jgi:uroporphyrinogen decarboxylase